MTTSDIHSRRQDEQSVGNQPVDRRGDSVLPALAAGLVSGGVIYATADIHLVLLSSVLGITSVTGAFVVWLVFSLLLGLTFDAVAQGTVEAGDGYVSDVGVGLGFGAVAALVAGTLVVPALGGADLPAVNVSVLLAYVLFGVVMAVGYGASIRGVVPSLTIGTGSGRVRATAGGSLLGGIVSGALLNAAAAGFLVQLGVIAGAGRNLASAFAVWVVLAVVLGAVFSLTAARTVGRGSGELLGYVKVGLVYGAVAGIVVGMVLVPLLVGAVSPESAPVPFVDSAMFAAFLLYGGLLGAGYGAVRREGPAVPASVSERLGPAVTAGAAGALVGGLFVQFAVGPVYFLYLSLTAKLGATRAAAYGTWLVLALGLAGLFVRYVAPDEDAISLTRASTRRGLAFGAVVGGALVALVPVMYRASTGDAYAFSGRDPLVFAGYLLLGAAIGAGYGLRREGLHAPAFGSRTQRAVGFGALFGGFTGGLVIHQLAGPVWMLYFGTLVGSYTYTGVWLAWLGLALVLGAAFYYTLARQADAYVAALRDVAEGTDGLLERAMERGELTTTTTLLGLAFGVGAAVVVGMVGMPVVVTVVGGSTSMPLPTTEPMVVVGYLTYGLFLGLGYGTLQEF